MARHGMTWHDMTWQGMSRTYGMARHGITWHDMTWQGMASQEMAHHGPGLAQPGLTCCLGQPGLTPGLAQPGAGPLPHQRLQLGGVLHLELLGLEALRLEQELDRLLLEALLCHLEGWGELCAGPGEEGAGQGAASSRGRYGGRGPTTRGDGAPQGHRAPAQGDCRAAHQAVGLAPDTDGLALALTQPDGLRLPPSPRAG